MAIGGIDVYALNPDEIYLEYLYSKPINCSGIWNSPIWEYEYGYEVKVGPNVIYSKSGTYKSSDYNPPPFEGYHFGRGLVNFILKRDRGYALSLKKYTNTPGFIDAISYSSEKGFFCEKKGIKWMDRYYPMAIPSELLTSAGERVSVTKGVCGGCGEGTAFIGFDPYFIECNSSSLFTTSFSNSDFNDTDITILRRLNEE